MFCRINLIQLLSVSDFEVIEQGLVAVLGGKASVEQVSPHVVPFRQAAIVKKLDFIGNYERHKPVGKALLEHYQTPHSAIAVLERMNCLKTLMEFYYIFKRLAFFRVVLSKQRTHFGMNIFGRCRFATTYFVRQPLVVTNRKPIFPAVGCPLLQACMKFFYKGFGKLFFGPINNGVDTTEMVGCLYYVIYSDAFPFDTDSICFKYKACLFMSEATTLDMVAIICKIDLSTMIYSTSEPCLFFTTQSREQRRHFTFATFTGRQHRITRKAPGLANEKGALYFPCRTIVTYGTFGNTIFPGKLLN